MSGMAIGSDARGRTTVRDDIDLVLGCKHDDLFHLLVRLRIEHHIRSARNLWRGFDDEI